MRLKEGMEEGMGVVKILFVYYIYQFEYYLFFFEWIMIVVLFWDILFGECIFCFEG